MYILSSDIYILTLQDIHASDHQLSSARVDRCAALYHLRARAASVLMSSSQHMPAKSPPVQTQTSSLQTPKKPKKPKSKPLRQFCKIFRSFPIISPACKMPISIFNNTTTAKLIDTGRIAGSTRLTGTLFGCKKGRVSLSIQENPQTLPMLVLELAIPTGKLLHDMGLGLVRIALECEKRPVEGKKRLIEEPIWNMYCNGNKIGYGVRREASEEDLGVMQWLHPVSMGAGVLPSETPLLNNDGELMYMRACFERVVGSKDSETYYMVNVDGHTGPELSIFFVRV